MAENFFTELKDKFQETDLYKSIYEATAGENTYAYNNKTIPAAILSEEDQDFVSEQPREVQKDINRYLDIFRNDPSPIYKLLADIKEKGNSELLEDADFVRKNTTDKFDNMRYSDYKTFGKSTFDLAFNRGTEGAKDLREGILGNPVVETITGAGHGLYQATRGTAELAASVSDLYLDTNYLKIVEEVLPQVDLSKLLDNPEPAFAQFVSLMVQYGTPVGIAQKIVKKVIGKATKTALAKKVAASAAATSMVGKTATNVAKFGGYWALPVAITDATVSASGQKTVSEIFGKSTEEGGNFIQDWMQTEGLESLEGIDGKERAARILRNKMKFGKEGAVFMGGLKLIPKVFTGFGKTMVKQADGTMRPEMMVAGLNRGAGIMLENVVGPTLTLASKVLNNKPVMKFMQGSNKFLNKSGIPDFKYWKFSEAKRISSMDSKGIIQPYGGVMSSIRSALESGLSTIMSGRKFGPQGSTILKTIEAFNKSAKKNFDIFAKDLDIQMYKLSNAGFNDILMGNETAAGALKHWGDVIRYMRGEIKLTQLPSPLQESSYMIRNLIDDQMVALKPIIKDMDVKEDLIKNMSKYLHQGYEIFKNPKFEAGSKVYDTAIKYFQKLMSTMPAYKAMSQKELITQARDKVNTLMTIGRSEGSTATERLKNIVNAAEEFVPKGTFKQFYTNNKLLPDEVADLLGRTNDPKKIILDTVVENAHMINTHNAYKELAATQMNNLFFRNKEEYLKFVTKNNIKNFRDIVPIKVKAGYHIDMQDIFKNKDGTMMMALPEISKAISDNTLIMDTLLKLPAMKMLLAGKAITQMNKTVLSLQTQMRNVTTAAMFATANGHVGAGASVMDSYRMFMDDLLGATKNPKEFARKLKEALDNGALDSSTVAQELEQIVPELMGKSTFFGKTVTRGGTTDELMKFMFTNKGIIGKIGSKATEAYQMGDNLWKFYGFNYSKSQLLPAFKNMDDVQAYFKLVEGYDFRRFKMDGTKKTLKDAIAEAAGLDVRNTYPNYSMIPTLVQNVRMIPFYGNFVAFRSEMYRNSFQIMKRGTRMLRSENPYVRQIGARKLVGFATTLGVAGPVAMDSAKTLTGITDEMYQAYKDSFAAPFEKAADMLPVTEQQDDGSWKANNLSTMIPYAAVTEPFKEGLQTWREGPDADESNAKVFAMSILNTFKSATAPFFEPSIFAETGAEVLSGFEMDNDGEFTGDFKTKTGSTITNWKIDPNWIQKLTYHMYKKLGPTTLLAAEKIAMALGGDLTKSGRQYDLFETVIQQLTGVSVSKQDPAKSMKYKVSGYVGELADARRIWSRSIVDQGIILEEIRSVENGKTPKAISSAFENLQSNNYRVMSELYTDVKNMRKMKKFTEKDIRSYILGKGSFGKQDVNLLMLGLYNADEWVNLFKTKDNAIKGVINSVNKEKGTFYTVRDVLDKQALQAIKSKYDNIPLGLNDEDRQKYLQQSSDFKLDATDKLIRERELTAPKAGPFEYLDTTEQETNQRRFDENQEKRKEFLLERQKKNITQSQAPASMTLPKLDNTMMASMTAGSAGDIDPTTLLTSNETALLSPSEQAYYINKRRA